MSRSWLFFIAVFTACISTPWSRAQEYTVTDLGTLPGDSYSEGLSINIWGHVVGCSGIPGWLCPGQANSTGGFAWTEWTGIRPLKPLRGDTATEGNSINDLDQIAGWSGTSINGANPHRAVVWEPDGRIRDLGSLKKNCNDCTSGAGAITDSGLVIGWSEILPNQSPFDPFLWSDAFGMINLANDGFPNSNASAINFFGHVAGTSSFKNPGAQVANLTYRDDASLWSEDAGMKDLGSLRKGAGSAAYAINNRDEVVGYATIQESTYHAFLWTKERGMEDLLTLDSFTPLAAFLDVSLAEGINDFGTVVGYSNYEGSGAVNVHAFIWTRDRGMRDLNDSIDPNSGWELESANAINNLGQITGAGLIQGQTHAFLLTPRHHSGD